jgi:hypothetical protein
METKVCKDCSTSKPVDEFYFNKTLKSYSSYCKICQVNRKKQSQKIRSKTKDGHLYLYLEGARKRAKDKKLECDLDVDYLKSIATDKCPIFNVKFIWGRYNVRGINTPSLDRVFPELGYIKGNVRFISTRANTIKNNITNPKTLYKVADWMWEVQKEVKRECKILLGERRNSKMGH